MSKKIGLVVGLVVVLSLAVAGTTFAQGQPNRSCQVTTTTPGQAAGAPGSAFNPNGKAGTVYAGTQPQNSNNPQSVSQYDVACYQQSTPPPTLGTLVAVVYMLLRF